MTDADKTQLLLECRSKAIDPEDLLRKLEVPVFDYSLFLCNEVLYWEVKESQILMELELLKEEFFQQIISDLKSEEVLGPGEAFNILKVAGFQFLNAYLPDLAKKVEAGDGSVFARVKGLGRIHLTEDLFKPKSLEEFHHSLMLHPSHKQEEWFDGLASCLMNNLMIVAGKSKFRIIECEFYYHNPESHPDPYVHGYLSNKDPHPQQSFGNLYWNDAGGLDITFGTSQIYAGILIRSLKLLGEGPNKYINGLWSVTSALINNMGSVLEGTARIQLQTATSSIKGKFTKSTRVNLKDPMKLPEEVRHLAETFRSKHYRYLIDIDVPSNRYAEKTRVIQSMR